MISGEKVNILLVDDRPENLLALEAILSKLGENLVRASSGQEALRCLLDRDFAAILLDVQMPGIDGFETAALIRQRERSRHTPIIFLTAFSTGETLVTKGYSLGAVDYLLKPIDPTILTSKVTVFVDLFKKTMEVKKQADQLAAMNVEIRQSEQRFRSLCACSPIGIFLTDTTGKGTYSNPRFQEICGFRIEENWQDGWGKFIHAEDRERVLSAWSNSTERSHPYADEFRIYTSDRSVRWVGLRTSPMLSDTKQILGQVGTIEDITDRKQAEAAREQLIREQTARQQAEKANRIKDQFLAIVSHELRTPLNSILGWSQLLLTRKFEPEATVQALKIIERNATAQTQLIDDILDVSKIMRGELRLSLQTVCLVEIVESVVETIKPQAEAKLIDFRCSILDANIGKDQKFMMSGDPDRLRQIILNLLSNAIKFTPESGQIEIKLQTVDPQSTAAQIQVIDNGIGITPDFLPHVFDRFRQADSTTTRSYGGLGLGLSIVRHLVKLHGGEIVAHSEGKDRGATFIVYLPLLSNIASDSNFDSEQNGRSQTAENLEELRLNYLQVLLVEDHTDTRDYITHVLEQSGAKVTAVSSVEAAIEYLENSTPQIIISDIGMPEADGYSLIRQLRDLEQKRGGKIPAIALTAYARIEDKMQALNAGFQMHVAKPVEPDQLISAIAQLAFGQITDS
jgi:PAS domain S-box-containing protein